jgi:hypothetical protein
MLISMPTGTSTIFGVFQAILALSFFNFFYRTDSALADKLVRNEKFASEIFFKAVLITFGLCCTAKGVHDFVRQDVQIQSAFAFDRMLTSGRTRQAHFRKELVRCRLFLTLSLQPKGLRPMPRYFFNTRIGDELISDPEGEDLRNPDRAWEVARAMIRELLKTEGTENGLLNAILEVTDGEGEIVLEFPFAEAIMDFSDAPLTRH